MSRHDRIEPRAALIVHLLGLALGGAAIVSLVPGVTMLIRALI